MGYRVELSAQAGRDLEQIVRFLARRNPAAAERLGLDTALSLSQLPYRGGAFRSRPGYRRIVHLPWFVIIYRTDDSKCLVEVARIWDSRQDPAGLETP